MKGNECRRFCNASNHRSSSEQALLEPECTKIIIRCSKSAKYLIIKLRRYNEEKKISI